MNWSLRRTTRPGKKIPDGVTQILTDAYLRIVHTISEDPNTTTPGVNTDQTYVTYSAGSTETYALRGSKQVEVVGKDEKWGFTLVVGISMSGDALPFQVIYAGKSKRSLPSPDAPSYHEATCHAPGIFRFSFPLLFFILFTQRQYETDTFVLLEHERNYKGLQETTGLLEVVTVPIQHIIMILSHQVLVIFHQPLDVSHRTKYRVFKLQHPISLLAHIEETLDPGRKHRIGDESRTALLWDRGTDGMRTWDNLKNELHVAHAPQSSNPTH